MIWIGGDSSIGASGAKRNGRVVETRACGMSAYLMVGEEGESNDSEDSEGGSEVCDAAFDDVITSSEEGLKDSSMEKSS